MGEVQRSGFRLAAFCFSPSSGVLTGFCGGCGSRETSKVALELGFGVPAPREALGLVGEPGSEAAGLEAMFPEGVLALGGGGLLGGAEVRWTGALFF